MKRIVIGIMPQEKIRERMLAVAKGAKPESKSSSALRRAELSVGFRPAQEEGRTGYFACYGLP